MSKNFETSDYGQPDDQYAQLVLFVRKTTAELNAMQTARTVGVGTLYFDTTSGGFRFGLDPATYSGVIMNNSGAVAITGGTINGTTIGVTTRASGAFTGLFMSSTDSTGTPGNVTNNAPIGRAAFAAAGTAVTVTNSSVVATSIVQVQVMGADATLTFARVTSTNAGNFVVTGNAAATGITPFNFIVINI